MFAGYAHWHEPTDLLQAVVSDHRERNHCDPSRIGMLDQLMPIDDGWKIHVTGQLHGAKVWMMFDSAALGKYCENGRYNLLLMGCLYQASDYAPEK